MATVSIQNKFLGSLIGAYIGHSYHEKCSKSWPSVSNSNLYQSWLDNEHQFPLSELTSSNSDLILTLPWLLYHYDDRRTRQQQLAQTIELTHDANKANIADMAAALYIMGDCLEWLMQLSHTIQYPLPLLRQHLRQQRPIHSKVLHSKREQFIQELATQSLMSDFDSVVPDKTLPMLMIAIKQCLSYRENLALALTSPQSVTPIPTLIGCLLGAWAGPSVIPAQWMLAFNHASKQALTDMAQKLYRRWAGITTIMSNGEVFPLEL